MALALDYLNSSELLISLTLNIQPLLSSCLIFQNGGTEYSFCLGVLDFNDLL
jgi:hypothetical protein